MPDIQKWFPWGPFSSTFMTYDFTWHLHEEKIHKASVLSSQPPAYNPELYWRMFQSAEEHPVMVSLPKALLSVVHFSCLCLFEKLWVAFVLKLAIGLSYYLFAFLDSFSIIYPNFISIIIPGFLKKNMLVLYLCGCIDWWWTNRTSSSYKILLPYTSLHHRCSNIINIHFQLSYSVQFDVIGSLGVLNICRIYITLNLINMIQYITIVVLWLTIVGKGSSLMFVPSPDISSDHAK